MQGISELRELLELLKAYGVSEFSRDGLSLKFGGGSGSFAVINHDSDGSAKEVREVRAPEIDPATRKLFDKLNPAYSKMFLGQ